MLESLTGNLPATHQAILSKVSAYEKLSPGETNFDREDSN